MISNRIHYIFTSFYGAVNGLLIIIVGLLFFPSSFHWGSYDLRDWVSGMSVSLGDLVGMTANSLAFKYAEIH